MKKHLKIIATLWALVAISALLTTCARLERLEIELAPISVVSLKYKNNTATTPKVIC